MPNLDETDEHADQDTGSSVHHVGIQYPVCMRSIEGLKKGDVYESHHAIRLVRPNKRFSFPKESSHSECINAIRIISFPICDLKVSPDY